MDSVNIESFFTTLNHKLEPPVQQHLKNVYSCVAISTLAAALGGYIHIFTNFLSGGLLSGLVSMGFLIALIATPDDGKNRLTRLGFLTAFAFSSGLGLGPMLEYAIAVDPAILPTAFLSTCLIFFCFTLSAMFADHRKFLYLGGTLMSLLSIMLLMAFINIFVASYFFFKMQVYLGLAVMCGFIMYDTQLIIEKRRRGDQDFIWHSVDLFIDLIKIFRYVVIILTEKERNKNKKN